MLPTRLMTIATPAARRTIEARPTPTSSDELTCVGAVTPV